MDQHTLDRTRRSLHGIAELILAGPQYAASQDIRLRVTPAGFGTVARPDLRVEADALVTPSGRVPISGTYADLAAAAGVEPRALRDVYADGPGVSAADALDVDEQAAGLILEAFARGDAALRAFAPTEQPVLWPEHFDIGISVPRVNYGVSPGDDTIGEPYAYVGPWTRLEGPFWDTPFGAARPLSSLPDVDSVAAFFAEGARLAVLDPPAPDAPYH